MKGWEISDYPSPHSPSQHKMTSRALSGSEREGRDPTNCRATIILAPGICPATYSSWADWDKGVPWKKYCFDVTCLRAVWPVMWHFTFLSISLFVSNGNNETYCQSIVRIKWGRTLAGMVAIVDKPLAHTQSISSMGSWGDSLLHTPSLSLCISGLQGHLIVLAMHRSYRTFM